MLHSSVTHLVEPNYTDSVHKIHRILTMIPSLQILFILSGYLFFIGYGNDRYYTLRDYKNKCRKRISSLYIPYLLWCTIGLGFGIFVTKEFQVDSLWDVIRLYVGDGICGHPSGRGMWYVRSLIVFSFLSPLYFYFVKFLKHLTPVFVLICIVNKMVAIDNGLFSPYILLGVYMSYYNLSLNKLSKNFTYKSITAFFVVTIIYSVYVHSIIGLSFITALIGLFLISREYPIKNTIVGASTFLYFSHLYFTGAIRTVIVNYMPVGLGWYVFDIIVIWIITVLLCLGIYFTMRKLCRPLLALLTGDRC